MLQDATNNVRGLVKDIEAGTYSTETGVKANDMISRWLEQVLLLEKTKAELSAQDIMRSKIDKEMLYYAPIGATIARKDRHIGFIRRQLYGNVESLKRSSSSSEESANDNCDLARTQPTYVPYECAANQPFDDIIRYILADILINSHVLLHYRVA